MPLLVYLCVFYIQQVQRTLDILFSWCAYFIKNWQQYLWLIITFVLLNFPCLCTLALKCGIY